MGTLALRAQVEAQLAARRDSAPHTLLEWAKLAVASVFSFETIYILYIFSGLYKSDPRLAFIPGDLTAIMFAVSVLWGVLLILRRGVRLRPRALNMLWLFLALCVWLWLSTLWSPSQWYAMRKSMYVPTLTLWALFGAAFIIAADERRLRRFFAMFTAFALFVSWESFNAIRASFMAGNFRALIRALGSHYGTLGVLVGNGALMLFLYMLYYARTWLGKLFLGSLMAGIMGLLLFMGSRTSLVFPVLAGIVPGVLNIRWPRTPGAILRWFCVGVLLCVAVVMLWSKLVSLVPGGPATLKRFATLERRGLESEGRFRNMFDALAILGESTPLRLAVGYGVGSWPLLLGDQDIQRYPHNITLEIAVELGLIGLALFAAMLIYGLRCLGPPHELKRSMLSVFLLTLFVSMLIIAHVSGDLHENRPLFMLLGLMTWDRRKVLPSSRGPV